MSMRMRNRARFYVVASASEAEGLDMFPGDEVRVSGTTVSFRMSAAGVLERTDGSGHRGTKGRLRVNAVEDRPPKSDDSTVRLLMGVG